MTKGNIKLNQIADFAARQHQYVNHKYGEHDYRYHLAAVAKITAKYAYLITNPARGITENTAVAVAWCHDLIEDTRLTYNDLKKKWGTDIAESVFALTNHKGRTRAERANDEYYREILRDPYAPLVKLADRVANTEESYRTKSDMFPKYCQELHNFKEKLMAETATDHLKPLWDMLDAYYRIWKQEEVQQIIVNVELSKNDIDIIANTLNSIRWNLRKKY